MITVFTPTFNRKNELNRLYTSLNNQTFTDFELLIVDDGSTDGTEEYVAELQKEDARIYYYKQINSGKHVAFNKGINEANGDAFICVDSDDRLISEALEKINSIYEKYMDRDDICGFVFQKGVDINNPLYKHFKGDEFIEDYIKYINNGNFKGDKCEVFITRILKKYRFPVFKNEKFMAEGFMWSKIGKQYKYVFVDTVIYLCEYLDNGLTKQGRKLRINNPLGGMNHASEFLDKCFNIKVRQKNALLYLTYARFASLSIGKIILNSKYKILLCINVIPSLILKYTWKKKYL